MGNHEDMFLNYRRNNDRSWLYNGYRSTLSSYCNHENDLLDDEKWIEDLPLYHEDKYFIYVHAGIDPALPMEEQSRDTLLWTREAFYRSDREYPKRVIFGHTPTMFLNYGTEPFYTSTGHIGIDTGCVYNGKLTALIIEDDAEKEFIQI